MTHWIKRLHMYTGLLTFAALLVYGIAGLTAAFQPAPDRRQRPPAEVRFELFTAPAGATDKQVADTVFERLKLPLATPVPGWAVRREAENNVTFDFYTVNGRTRVTVLEKENRLLLEAERNSIWHFVDALHSTTMGARSPDLRLRLWKYYNEFAIWCLLVMAFSGVYLWLASRPGHRIAQVCFAAGSGGFVVLYILTR